MPIVDRKEYNEYMKNYMRNNRKNEVRSKSEIMERLVECLEYQVLGFGGDEEKKEIKIIVETLNWILKKEKKIENE